MHCVSHKGRVVQSSGPQLLAINPQYEEKKGQSTVLSVNLLSTESVVIENVIPFLKWSLESPK